MMHIREHVPGILLMVLGRVVCMQKIYLGVQKNPCGYVPACCNLVPHTHCQLVISAQRPTRCCMRADDGGDLQE